MLGKAIMEGAISGLDQKLLISSRAPRALCQHPYRRWRLLASGLQWSEKYYSPFSVTAAPTTLKTLANYC